MSKPQKYVIIMCDMISCEVGDKCNDVHLYLHELF